MAGNLQTGTLTDPISGNVAAVTSVNALKVDSSGTTQPVSQQANEVINATLQNAATGNVSGQVFHVSGFGTLLITFTDNFVGTLNFEGSADGINYGTNGLTGSQLGSTATGTSFTGTNSGNVYIYQFSIAALSAFQVPISGYVSGSITVTAYAIPIGGASGGGSSGGGSSVSISAPIGQAKMSASVSVVIASDQTSQLMNLGQFNGVGIGTTNPVLVQTVGVAGTFPVPINTAYTIPDNNTTIHTVLTNDGSTVTTVVTYPNLPGIGATYYEFQTFTISQFKTQIVTRQGVSTAPNAVPIATR